MAKAEQLNEVIKNYLGEVISSEVESPNFLITISEVRCSSDLFAAKVFVSVLPENFSGTALKSLRSKSGHLSKILKSRAGLVRVPKLFWEIDASFKAVKNIGDIFEVIEKESL